MSAKKVENPVEETVNEEVKNTEEVAEQKTATSETQNTEEKNEEIIKEDEVIIEEKNIIPAEEAKELNVDEVKEVEAKKVTVEKNTSKEVKLKVLIAFTDKYTDEDRKVNDVITVDPARAEELLSDERGVVEKVN